jgi:hypothetical protein
MKKAVGYKARDSGTHRRYSFAASIRRYKRTGRMVYRGNGSGHRAGEAWGEKKNIDPDSPVQRYSKNSPSFDEGVWKYKRNRKLQALVNKQEE